MSANPFAFGSVTNVSCCECGVYFASPVLAERLNDKQSFYCPNGHCQSFLGESYKQKIERLTHELTAQKTATWKERSRADAAESRVGQFKVGKCPSCGQRFRRLREHMRDKHPKFK